MDNFFKLQGKKDIKGEKTKPTEQATTRTVMSVGLACLTLKITKAGPGAILTNLSEKNDHEIQIKIKVCPFAIKRTA